MSSIYTQYPQLYDYLYGGDDDKVIKFVSWLLDFLKIGKDKQILDIGAGTGNIMIPLSKKGYSITGVEPYKGMRDIALEKIKNSDIKLDATISEGRIENIESLKGSYDLLLLMNGPFHYLSPEMNFQKVFNQLFSKTNPGGYLLLDVMNFYSLIKHYERPEIQEFQINETNFVVQVSHDIDLHSEIYTNKAIIFVQQESNDWVRIVDDQKLLMYNKRELISYANSAGFEFVSYFSSYSDTADSTKYDGSRLILLFKRPVISSQNGNA